MIRNYRCTLNLFLLLFLSACAQEDANEKIITVMTYNTGDDIQREPTMNEVVHSIKWHNIPDILFVQDTPWSIKVNALAEQLEMPYYVSGRELTNNYVKLGILSRFPLEQPEILLLYPDDSQHAAAMCARTNIANNDIMLCTLHLQSPSADLDEFKVNGKSKVVNMTNFIIREMFDETVRTRSVDKLLRWNKIADAEMIIIGGDFNSFQFSKPERMMSTYFNDAFWPSMNYFSGTYNKLSLPVKPRIDYIFHSEGFRHIDNSIAIETAGDHFPVQATLAISKKKSPISHLLLTDR